MTPTTQGPRTLLPSLRALPSLSCPPALLPITLLHSTIPSILSTSLSLFFRTWFRIDPLMTPTAHAISSFFISMAEIFVKLPLETVMRRGHIAVLNSTPSTGTSTRSSAGQKAPLLPLHTTGLSPRMKTIVPVGPYKGVLGTILYIIHEEGSRSVSASRPSSIPSTPRIASSTQSRSQRKQERRGQGVKGLVKGWRVGFWALIGIYATAGLNASGQQEF
jgi:fusion and transport protein UGO1